MKFSQYLILTENQAHYISDTDAIKMLKVKCQYAYTHNIPIYRGMPSKNEYQFGSAEFDEPRRSANTTNYSTLIIDNSPEWAPYPKRSKSYICSTDAKYATEYGSLYKVFPFDGANIGICPELDIWFSFHKLQSVGGITDISTFNRMLQDLFFYHYNQQDRNDTTFENIKQGCESIDAYVKSINYDYNQLPPYKLESWERRGLEKLTRNKQPILSNIMKVLSPSANGFEHTNIEQITKLPSHREVWTDSPCIFKRI